MSLIGARAISGLGAQKREHGATGACRDWAGKGEEFRGEKESRVEGGVDGGLWVYRIKAPVLTVQYLGFSCQRVH